MSYALYLSFFGVAVVSGFGIYWVIKTAGQKEERLKNAESKAKDARKDADIANRPHKRGSALLDSLRGKRR